MSFKDRLQNLFKSAQTIADEEAANVARIKAQFEAAAEEKRITEEKIREEVIAQMHTDRLASPVPWFEAVLGVPEEADIATRYQWNAAFIAGLVAKGHTGENDVEIIQAYLDDEEAKETQRRIEKERDLKRNSSELWVEVICESVDEEGRIALQLDWNDAFIKHLHAHGYRGQTDDILVQQWLANLDRSIDSPTEFH